MKLIVIGCGHVGETIADALENAKNDVVRIDPKYNDNKLEHFVDKVDGAVICLPTPTINGEQDLTEIDKTVIALRDVPTLIKSTILPNMLTVYEENVVYSPEFLREAHAKKDFKNNQLVLWGGLRSQADFWIDCFDCHDKTNIIMDKKSASVIKYVYNCWLATKVTFFHELHEKLDKTYNYNMIINTLADFENIGPSHMKVKQLGYDGNCFPKDMEAFANFLDSELLKSVIKVNESLVSSR
jgi:UDPglucose 6-dehydrogenase